jgi:hypothetical protein
MLTKQWRGPATFVMLVVIRGVHDLYRSKRWVVDCSGKTVFYNLRQAYNFRAIGYFWPRNMLSFQWCDGFVRGKAEQLLADQRRSFVHMML